MVVSQEVFRGFITDELKELINDDDITALINVVKD